MLKSVLLPLALLASLGAAPAASASAAAHVQVVRYDEQNLAGPAARRALRLRIAMAVEAVCGAVARRPIDEVMAVRACQADARANADAQIEQLVRLAEQRRATVAAATP